MNNLALFEQVKALNLPLGKYALFGSALLGVRGLKQCHDADIIVLEDIFKEYEEKGWKMKEMPHGSKFLCNGDIELWQDWFPGEWNIEQLISNAEVIDGLPFVKIEEVIKWKKLNGREKDLKDIELAEQFLKSK
jgi:hypothetical protein